MKISEYYKKYTDHKVRYGLGFVLAEALELTKAVFSFDSHKINDEISDTSIFIQLLFYTYFRHDAKLWSTSKQNLIKVKARKLIWQRIYEAAGLDPNISNYCGNWKRHDKVLRQLAKYKIARGLSEKVYDKVVRPLSHDVKNIIFDWSGVISDDYKSTYNTAMKVMQKLLGKTIPFEEYQREFVLPYMDFWHKYDPTLDKARVDEIFRKELYETWVCWQYEGSKKPLKELKAMKKNMIVLSSHPQAKLESEVIDFGLAGFFKEINGSVHDKIAAIRDIMTRNSFLSHNTIYVGDMRHDIRAGKKAGVRTVAVTYGYESRELLAKEKPDYVINELSELIFLLR